MAKKLHRVFRDTPLSAEEANRDAEIREKIEQEFPSPTTASAQIPSMSFSESLRKAILGSDRPLESIADEVGLSPLLLERFVRRERDIRVATAERLASVLGLKFVAVP